MKLLNVPPIKAGQYARYSDMYVWKCTAVKRRNPYGWTVRGVIMCASEKGWATGEAVSGYWSDMDVLLTEEETNEIIERTTV